MVIHESIWEKVTNWQKSSTRSKPFLLLIPPRKGEKRLFSPYFVSAAILIHIWRPTDSYTLSAVQKNITRGNNRSERHGNTGGDGVCMPCLFLLLKLEGFRAPKKKSNFFIIQLVSPCSTLFYWSTDEQQLAPLYVVRIIQFSLVLFVYWIHSYNIVALLCFGVLSLPVMVLWPYKRVSWG